MAKKLPYNVQKKRREQTLLLSKKKMNPLGRALIDWFRKEGGAKS
jgi:hypothetical protein